MKFSKIFVLLLTLSFSLSLLAQEPMAFDNKEQQNRFNQLTQELRCVVCQNQNLADSDAQLAHDLRSEVYEMLQTGKSNEEIKEFLVQRYGDFVLYKPPMQKNTYLLWIAPGLMLLIGALVLRSSVKKRAALMDSGNTDNQQENVE